MIDLSELFKGLLAVIFATLVTCALVSTCAREKSIRVIGNVNGYDIVELDDGHQYLRRRGLFYESLIHYADCPKCKSKEE